MAWNLGKSCRWGFDKQTVTLGRMIGSDALRIIGFDPGLNVTGYGVIVVTRGKLSLIEAGTVRSRGVSLESRLAFIYAGVREVLETFKPSAVAVEDLFVHAQFPRTAVLMGHARGVICLAAALADVSVHHYPPTRVKRMLTGSGRAGKEQMQAAIQRELSLPHIPKPADAADALAVAIADYHMRIRLCNTMTNDKAPRNSA